VLDKDGQLVNAFTQPCSTRYGLCDLEWDGDRLWGSGDRTIYGFTTDGNIEYAWPGPQRINQAIAWDSDRERLWICGITSPEIIGYNRNGNALAELDQHGFRIRGLAYWPEDPDHYNLYIFHSPNLDSQVVHKMDPETGDTMFVAKLFPEGGGSPGGCYITNQYDVYSWVFVSVSDKASQDRVDIWQIDARRDWFLPYKETVGGWLAAEAGRIDAGQTQQFKLALNTADLIKELFEAYLVHWHNAAGGEDTIRVELKVIGPTEPKAFSLVTPVNGDSVVNSQPVEFSWERSVDPNYGEQSSYRIWFRAGMDSVMFEAPDTTISADVGALGLNLADDVQVIWWVQAISGVDVVESRERFTLRYFIEEMPGEAAQPVEFGINAIYPTPFNARTAIKFGADRAERLTIRAYDIQGRLIATLYDRVPRVAYHQLTWDATALPAGLYMIRLESGGRIRTAKVALVK